MNKKLLRNTIWCIILVTAVTLLGTINTMNTDDPEPKGVNITAIRNV